MKYLFILTMVLLGWPQTATMKINDLDRMCGKKWSGTLTYLDYGTHQLVPVKTELNVKVKSPGDYEWITSYPEEPSHNSTDDLVISPDGKTFDGEKVTARSEMNGSLLFSTEKDGNDDHKAARFRFSYVITATTFSRKKEVCYSGEQQWITRNELLLKTN
jgi:hypothetical protein